MITITIKKGKNMKSRYHYFKSSKTEAKHEITRKEFIKLLGESNHCVKHQHIANGLYMGISDYEAAERMVRNAQRDKSGGSIWSCGSLTLYLEKDRSQMRRRRDSRYPD